MRSTLLVGLFGLALCVGACSDDDEGEGTGGTAGSGNTGNVSSSSSGSGSGASGSGGDATGATGGQATGGEAAGGDATGGAGEGGAGQGGAGGAMQGAFGSTCTAEGDCNDPYVCIMFDNQMQLCTKECTENADCEPEAQMCNNKGYCKPF